MRQWQESEEFWREAGDEDGLREERRNGGRQGGEALELKTKQGAEKEGVHPDREEDGGKEPNQGICRKGMEVYERALTEAEDAWREWHERCLEWYGQSLE